MGYRELKKTDFPSFEKEILKFWKENNIFKKSIEGLSGKKEFVFYEGPPSANGMPGIHHVMARTIKDIFCRYKTMQGYKVARKGGWDTHGLPVELQVEKELGISREEIGKTIPIKTYNEHCRNTVMRYKKVWDDLTERMGYWVDLDNPYITYNNKYIESLWYILYELYNKGLLYKGYSIQPYSPAAGTGLSSHELNQPGTYKTVKDQTAVAMFELVESENIAGIKLEGKTYMLAWTTTPWTLPSNTALAVGSAINYTIITTINIYNNEKINVILAEALILKHFETRLQNQPFDTYKSGEKNAPWQVAGNLQGKELAGLPYYQLFSYVKPTGNAFRVLTDNFVTTDDGTGVVHIAPSFGADDFRVAKQNEMASLTLVDRNGRFLNEVIDFAGEFVKESYYSESEINVEIEKQKTCNIDTPFHNLIKSIVNRTGKYLSVDERIVLKLQLEGKLFRKDKYEHTYPHCWRTDKPILYYPLDSWFIKTTAVKDRMVELNKTIHWKPESTGSGRFGNWLENLQDWNLSRSRYWGTPLPIWRSKDGKQEVCVKSVQDLLTKIDEANKKLGLDQKVTSDIDLHRPFVDGIILVGEGNTPLYREPDLIDVWFDSGAMPFAQVNWMGQTVEPVDEAGKSVYPADFIAEGVDQTRGWFFTLHAIGTMLTNQVAYKNVISNGLVLDKNGNKMSKRLGNVINPTELIDEFGIDAVRWYLISNSDPWDNLKFDKEGVAEVQRSFFGTLYNTYNFYAMYANIDQYAVSEENTNRNYAYSEIDKWILSKLNTLVGEVTELMDKYDPTPAARLIANFLDRNLSNWFVRLNRRRFWKGEMSVDKEAAYQTLYTCLTTLTRLMSPFSPFFSDFIYKNLTGEASIHLSRWPSFQPKESDTDLETRMELAQEICSLILSIRKKSGIKVRQPLLKVLIPVQDEKTKDRVYSIAEIVKAEVNVKEVIPVSNSEIQLVKKAKPDFKKLGSKLGNNMKSAAEEIAKMNQQQIDKYELEGKIELTINGSPFTFTLGDIVVFSEDIPGWQVASEGSLTLALDTQITPDLKSEGLARELINRLQNLRKELGFEITNRIVVLVQDRPLIVEAVQKHNDYICREILADKLELVEQLETGVEIELEEITTRVELKPINR